VDRLPPDLQHVSPHSWLSEELKQSYEERIARKGFFELYVSKLAMQKMINHSKMLGREEREAMGFMLGDICRHESHGFVMVRDYVIVGWYHSHPGFGCFMSKTDMKTQSTLFSERFHSAIVIDPVREEIMAFRLRGKRCAPLDFSVYWHELETPYRGKKIMRRSRVLRRDRR